MNNLESTLVPILICVVLPIAIVFILAYFKNASEKKRAQIIIKAIEANNNIDVDKLAESLKRPHKSTRQILYSRLLKGCIFSFMGLAIFLFGIYSDISLPEAYFWIGCYPAAGVLFSIGLGFLVTYFVTRNQINDSEE